MKVYIETYGCWLNKGESQVMASLLEKRGARLVESIDEADVVIVNTCAVRGDTETKMLRRIRELEDYRRKLGFRLVVAGCLVNIRPKTILEISPEASLVEPDAVEKIGDVVFSDKQVFFVRQYRGSRTILPRYSGGPTYVVPIQTGCLGNCAFCVEWVGRGRGVKSYSPRLIVDAVLDAVRRGAKEVYLTGQDVAAYGVDIGLSLVDLVEAILESVEGEYWIRLGMMEPLLTFKQIDRLLVLVRDERMYKYFHIPVQSGDDRVLRLMNRKYTVQQYKDLVGKIRKGLGRWHSLVTDLIVGFPGEDEEAFLNSLKLIEELEFDKVHVARYTLRPFTRGYVMKGVLEPEKKRRSKMATEVVMKVAYRVNSRYIGQEREVLVNSVSMKGDFTGRTIEYKPVVLKGYSLKLGEKVRVKIVDATPVALVGEVID